VPRQMPLIRFFEDLEKHVDELFVDDVPPFTLVLGAGASRSAGIPVTSEMVDLLRLHIKLRWPDFERFETVPTGFSELVSTIYSMTQDEWDIREFLRLCIRRGSREPNLLHLIAANLACTGVFRPIITTNFDDLALAAFWSLPPNESYSEPYVIYDPRMVRTTRIDLGEDTPVIIKAHGHHTQYGMGIIETQIRDLSPFVKRIIRLFEKPRVGYIVVGCSGGWPDGLMDALKDRQWTRGKVIYWFYRGKELPDLSLCRPLREVVETSDVRFVRCDDPDYLFFRLWSFFKDSGMGGSAWVLDEYDLFAAPTIHEQAEHLGHKANEHWWKPAPEPHRLYVRPQHRLEASEFASQLGTRSQSRHDLGIPNLRRKILPLLLEIEKWDREHFMPYECLPRRLRSKFDWTGAIEFVGEPPALEQLREATTPRIPWTRRNRQLLKIALAPQTDPYLSFSVLRAIDSLATPNNSDRSH
jgi:hypothetical protein